MTPEGVSGLGTAVNNREVEREQFTADTPAQSALARRTTLSSRNSEDEWCRPDKIGLLEFAKYAMRSYNMQGGRRDLTASVAPLVRFSQSFPSVGIRCQILHHLHILHNFLRL
jgi:hypothetical protein